MADEPVPLYSDESTDSSFASANFSSSSLLDQIPDLTNQRAQSLKVSVLDVYLLREFSEDTSEIMLKEVDGLEAIGHAVVIKERFILSARHIFNDCSNKDIILYNQDKKEFYSMSVLEDGAKGKQDYLIGILEEFDSISPLYPNRIPLGDSPSTVSMITLVSWGEMPKSQYTPSDYENLLEISYLASKEGDCGLPWVNPDGKMFAIHCKRCDKPLFGQQKIGLPISIITQNSKYLSQIIYGSCNYQNTRDIKQRNYNFSEFTNACYELEEIDEGGKRRDFALGATPSITNWKNAPKIVLHRFFVEGKAKLVLPSKKAITIETLQEKYSKKPSFIQKAISNLIKDDDNKLYWQVLVYVDAEGTNLCFTSLFKKNGSSDLHMGHILPCNAFWNEGPQNFLKEQCDAIEESDDPNKDNKIKKLTKYYNTYTISGAQSWLEGGGRRTEYIQKFMADGNNYEFQTAAYNLAKSGEEKTKYGGFKAPEGYEWKNVNAEGDKRKKFELLTIAPMVYKKFVNLTATFEILDVSKNEYKSVNELPWLTDEMKNKPHVKTDFVKNKLGDKLQLRIQENLLTDEQKENAKTLFNGKKQKMGDNLEKKLKNGFFWITYQKSSGDKIKRTQIYEASEEIVTSLDNIMKPNQ